MNHNFIIALFVSASIMGCAGVTHKKMAYDAPNDAATIKLAEAASSISDSILDLAKIEKVIVPPNKDNTLTIPNADPLQARASVDWTGPINELTERIAKAAGYRLRVLGQAPVIPVLIGLNLKDQSLGEILRNIDYQARKSASIHVYPKSQVIELRYAKSYS